MPAMRQAAEADWLEASARVVDVFCGGVWVETQEQAGCHGCAARASCGSGLLSRFRARPRLKVVTSQGFQVGDSVRLRIPARSLLSAALIAYAWPLLFAVVAGSVAESLAAPGHAVVPMMFAAGLIVGVGVSRWHGWRWRRRHGPQLLVHESAISRL